MHLIDDEPPASPLDVLRKANKHGEIGYAYGGGDTDLAAVRECERRGWIVYVTDVSPGPNSPYYGQKRELYRLTDAGRAALSQGEKP